MTEDVREHRRGGDMALNGRSFLRTVPPGDLFRIAVFIVTVIYAGAMMKFQVEQLRSEIANNKAVTTAALQEIANDRKQESLRIRDALEELKVEQAKTSVLLERMIRDQDRRWAK